MIALLRRWLEKLDGNLSPLDRHLELAIPSRSTSPLSMLPSRSDVERIGTFPCCPCLPPDCDELHRTPCDMHQEWPAGGDCA